MILLLNFTTKQRKLLLNSPSTLALLYTPANEHFGIGPVEGMICGLPIIACDSGGPKETVIRQPDGTGYLLPPTPDNWTSAMIEIFSMSPEERKELSLRARTRAEVYFSIDNMILGMDAGLREAMAMGKIQQPSAWIIVVPIVLLIVSIIILR